MSNEVDVEEFSWTELVESARKLLELSIIKVKEEQDNA